MARRTREMAAEGARAEVEDTAALADVAALLRYLRGLAEPCAPPVGVGAFDVLCASERHILVWYTPAREGHEAREYAIPTPALAAAWAALRSGEPLTEAALVALGGGAAVGRWLLALLAQLPGVRVAADEETPLTLRFSIDAAPAEETSLAEMPRTHPPS